MIGDLGSIPAHTGKPPTTSAGGSWTRVYPRPHGEAITDVSVAAAFTGLSPPTRGSPGRAGPEHRRDGSIPAHTGKPHRTPFLLPLSWVYPRPHGEAGQDHQLVALGGGLSPPTRGSLHRRRHGRLRRRSIPAHTGKPSWPRPWARGGRVYPRPHGEAGPPGLRRLPCRGLSPPTRGSRRDPLLARHPGRSIPAHTGKPLHSRPNRTVAKVYPRPHGEAWRAVLDLDQEAGLSPPTRGSRSTPGRRPWPTRSIPAHTGKPLSLRCSRSLSWVYPRPHGEAPSFSPQPDRCQGLSPPTRGSPPSSLRRYRRTGSIPAHTGKPTCVRHAGASSRVYPRPHGEAGLQLLDLALPRRSIPAHTGKPGRSRPPPPRPRVYPRPHGEADGLVALAMAAGGLSPPTRGSLGAVGPGRTDRGSIPAHTGKPYGTTSALVRIGVYPRPHGEALSQADRTSEGYGLSPPTRGSLAWLAGFLGRYGSIPAHTGKPVSRASGVSPAAVYPRPHGEAIDATPTDTPLTGLSPPTRGSHRRDAHRHAADRSIPAHTGKPRYWHVRSADQAVYPRPHGEAAGEPWRPQPARGLSPPTRGSRTPPSPPENPPGSIPAHTGKPTGRRARRSSWRVYPRPHGEASVGIRITSPASGLSPPTRGSRAGPARGP